MNIKKKGYYLIVLVALLFIWVISLFFLTPIKSVSDFFTRFAVLLGYTCLFLATLMTPFMKQLYQLYGKPFIKIHHYFSISGIILITIHPISFAIEVGSIAVFIPRFDSWIVFWELAGRPALYIIYVAVLAVILRKQLSQKVWRILHGLNYVALIFGYIHGVLIGTDFKNLGILITFTIMIILTFAVLIYKRYLKYKVKRRKINSNK
jgi:predicted ferric reductase